MTVIRRTRAPATPAQHPETVQARQSRARKPPKPAEKKVEEKVDLSGPLTVSKAVKAGLIPLDHNPDREYNWSDKVDYPQIIASSKDDATSYKNAIRSHCVDCMGGLVQAVKDCSASPDKEDHCSLWPFRMGENPFDARTIKARSKE